MVPDHFLCLLNQVSFTVNWLAFTGKVQPGNSVLLKWQTSSELNSVFYRVQRSTDGVTFQVIGIVNANARTGSATTGNTHTCTFTDTQAPSGSIYYRIEQVDQDGKSTYSAILPINYSIVSASSLYIINNPVRSTLRVHIIGVEAGARLQLFDMKGRQLVVITTTADAIQQ